MKIAMKDHLIDWLPKAGLRIALVDTSSYSFKPDHRDIREVKGWREPVRKLSQVKVTVDGLLTAADEKFFALHGQVGGVVIFAQDGRVIAYNDELPGFPLLPKGGDLTVELSHGILQI